MLSGTVILSTAGNIVNVHDRVETIEYYENSDNNYNCKVYSLFNARCQMSDVTAFASEYFHNAFAFLREHNHTSIPILSYPILSYPKQSYPFLSYPIRSEERRVGKEC